MDNNAAGTVDGQGDRDGKGLPTGSPAGEADGQWLPLRAASERLGLGHVALRKRAQRATVLARKDADGEWEVFVQAGARPLVSSTIDEDVDTDRDSPSTGLVQPARDDPGTDRVRDSPAPSVDLGSVRLVDLLREQIERTNEQARELVDLASVAAMHQERARGEAERRAMVEHELDQTTARLAAAEARIKMLEAGPIASTGGSAGPDGDHNDSQAIVYGIPTSPVTTEPRSEPVSWWRRLFGS